MKIAVDIDGVLADQVGAILKVIKKEYGQSYSKNDVNRAHWSFAGVDIWSKIAKSLDNPVYVLGVPLIDGSQKAMLQLTKHDIFVVTARTPNTEVATKLWLETHFPCLKEYYYAMTGTKYNVPSDVLIDDLDMNIVEFVKSDPNRRGILFMHPWSINDTDIESYSNQVYFCSDWQSVVSAINEIDRTVLCFIAPSDRL